MRRIEFHDVTGIDDRVLRQEMLQLEGAYLNTVALEQSLRRLERLPYVATIDASLRPVEGSADVVDVVITVVEAPARRYGGGGAYSESLLTSLHAYYIDENILGSGTRLAFTIEGSELRSGAQVSHIDPYAGAERLSRTVAFESRRIDRITTDASTLDAELASLTLQYGYPMALPQRGNAPQERIADLARAADELLPTAEVRGRLADLEEVLQQSGACCQSIRFGLDLRRATLEPRGEASRQLLDWIEENGDPSSGGAPAMSTSEADFLLQWRRDTRDRPIFPERGLKQTLSFTAALPGSDVEYYLADYEAAAYLPLGRRWTAQSRGRIGFGAAYGAETTALPPYLNWFAGGPPTVRGYRENALGPRDSLGNPYGGNLLAAAQFELLTPWPERWRDRTRVGFLLDVGNVFSTEDVRFADGAGRRLDYGFDASDLRASVGLTADVLIPLGLLRISYAVPLDANEDHANPFLRDDVERFQISIGIDY